MRPALRHAPTALLLGLLCSACSSPVAVMQPQAKLPASLWQCKQEPPQPTLGTDADLADWIVDLAYAGRDCREKLAGAKTALGQ
jgi:hypothetical protein